MGVAARQYIGLETEEWDQNVRKDLESPSNETAIIYSILQSTLENSCFLFLSLLGDILQPLFFFFLILGRLTFHFPTFFSSCLSSCSVSYAQFHFYIFQRMIMFSIKKKKGRFFKVMQTLSANTATTTENVTFLNPFGSLLETKFQTSEEPCPSLIPWTNPKCWAVILSDIRNRITSKFTSKNGTTLWFREKNRSCSDLS